MNRTYKNQKIMKHTASLNKYIAITFIKVGPVISEISR